MITSCTQSNPWIMKQLKLSPVNVKGSSGQVQTQRSHCPSPRTQIKPPQLPHLMTSRFCLNVKRLFAWTKKSWTSSGSTTSRGDSIKDPRGTTYVQPPSRYKFAPKQAKHAILRAIMHNNPSTLATEPAWKALMLSSWLLLGRPAENAVERKCAHYMEARLDLF